MEELACLIFIGLIAFAWNDDEKRGEEEERNQEILDKLNKS